MLDRVRRTAARYDMLPPGCAVIAAVSGGSDSVAMLDLLCRLRQELGFELRAAHVNHGLRGAAADADEAFVADICAAWGVPLSVLHADVAAEAKKRGLGVEDCGRQVRYAFLASLDPVALDQACVDLVYAAKDDPGLPKMLERIESQNGLLTIEAAAALGVGSREYELIEVE